MDMRVRMDEFPVPVYMVMETSAAHDLPQEPGSHSDKHDCNSKFHPLRNRFRNRDANGKDDDACREEGCGVSQSPEKPYQS